MHECPECGQACDCDGDDTFMNSAPREHYRSPHAIEHAEEDDAFEGLGDLYGNEDD